MRLIMETEAGVQVSEGAGWRDPEPGEFLAMDDGSNFLALNAESVAVAWWKGFGAGIAVALVSLAVFAAVAAERIGS